VRFSALHPVGDASWAPRDAALAGPAIARRRVIISDATGRPDTSPEVLFPFGTSGRDALSGRTIDRTYPLRRCFALAVFAWPRVIRRAFNAPAFRYPRIVLRGPARSSDRHLCPSVGRRPWGSPFAAFFPPGRLCGHMPRLTRMPFRDCPASIVFIEGPAVLHQNVLAELPWLRFLYHPLSVGGRS